jgi:hypothetical protein
MIDLEIKIGAEIEKLLLFAIPNIGLLPNLGTMLLNFFCGKILTFQS